MIRTIEQPELNDLIYNELDDTTADDAMDYPPAEMLRAGRQGGSQNSADRDAQKHPAVGLQSEDQVSRTKNTLRILIVDITATQPIISLTRHFTDQTGIEVIYDICPQEELHEHMRNDYETIMAQYDLYTYNAPWRDIMYENGCLADLSDFETQYHLNRSRFFSQTLDNCLIGDKLFGIPFTAASQIMFYRNDFRENNTISLRPPRTWTEFNNVAAFFTRSVNPESPTAYGTSFAAKSNEFLGPELLIRLLSYGGGLWDTYNYPTFSSPGNLRAFEAVLSTLQYVAPDYGKMNIDDTIEDFCSGRTAMPAAVSVSA